MARLSLFVIVLVVVAVAWYVRRARARRRLQEIDEGRLCVACGATDMTRTIDQVRCNRCGYVASLAALQRTQLSEQDISNLTSPDDRRGF